MSIKVKGFVIPLLLLSFTSFAEQAFEATPLQIETIGSMLEKLSANHYRKRDINDEFSIELYESYLSALDPSKSFLLAEDIALFDGRRLQLDNELRAGNVNFGFEVFKHYRDVATRQIERNIVLLESDYQFDLLDDEIIRSDIESRKVMTSATERDEWWRLRTEDALLRLILSDKELSEARELLLKRYKNQLIQLQEMDGRDVFQAYGNAITALYDPHTTYFSPRTSENFNINMSLSLEGIGAVLTRDEDYTKVVRIVPGGPADKEGQLKEGDIIIGVAQGNDGEIDDIVGSRLDDSVDKIRGPKDSVVRLQIIPAKAASSDVSKIIEIVRDTVKLEEQAAQSEVIEVPFAEQTFRIGVIDVPTFYFDFEGYRDGDTNPKRTSADVAKLLETLSSENIDGIILDLRGNGGGSLHEATAMTDLFVNPGPVVQIRSSSNNIDRRQRARRPSYYNGHLVVLIDRLSASASEILAGAIQDYGRGVIVGSQSFGKGTVQVMLPLNEGQLKMTESKFYRISGESTQHRGIVPDVSFPSEHLFSEIGESNEKNALPWDTIKAASYRRYGNLTQALPLLNKAHRNRTENDPDFIFIEGRIALSERYREEDKKSLSLNIDYRRQLKDQREMQTLALENKRRISKGLQAYATTQAWRNEIEGVSEEDIASDGDNASDSLPQPATETDIVSATEEPALIDEDVRPLDERDPKLLEAGRILADLIVLGGDLKYANQNR